MSEKAIPYYIKLRLIQGSGTSQSILNKFFEYCPRDVFLSVRSDNLTANNFYVKMNMKLIGKTTEQKHLTK